MTTTTHAARALGPWGLGDPTDRNFRLTGWFTMLKYVLHCPPRELERRLGLPFGYLDMGGWLVTLAPGEVVRPQDFVLGASTRWSNGQLPGLMPCGKTDEAQRGPPRSIGEVLAQRQQDVGALTSQVAAFFGKHWRNTPAKVISRHPLGNALQFPDAEALRHGVRSGVPQFRLANRVAKRAVLIRSIPAFRPPHMTLVD